MVLGLPPAQPADPLPVLGDPLPGLLLLPLRPRQSLIRTLVLPGSLITPPGPPHRRSRSRAINEASILSTVRCISVLASTCVPSVANVSCDRTHAASHLSRWDTTSSYCLRVTI